MDAQCLVGQTQNELSTKILELSTDHKRFSSYVREALSRTLPGQEAQYKMVPPSRPRTNLTEVRGLSDVRKASVLALIHPIDNAPHLTFIRRNDYPGVHSGQISFPGGKVEPNDTSLEHTALRETQEEVGVQSSAVELISSLTEVYIPPSRFLVRPYVGIAHNPLEFQADPREVKEILHFPLSVLLQPDCCVEREVRGTNYRLNVPAFEIENHIIWGATAMMLSELITALSVE